MNEHGQRVLIVDEYALSRTAMRIGLRTLGHACISVGTAREAILCIDTFAPSVVIFEWLFRDGSGIGLCDQMQRRSAVCGRELVVIALSVMDEPLGFRRSDNVHEYLTKPVAAEVVERAFERHLRDSRSSQRA